MKQRINSNLLGIVFILFVGLIMSTQSVNAQQQATYIVKQGDTLFGISKELNVSIAELRQWNDIENNNISIGQELSYYIPDPADTEGNLDQDETSNPLINRSAGEESVFYTVKSGDNLYSIAREHNMTLEQLKALNDLDSDEIFVGQQLAVKRVDVAPNVSTAFSESTPQGAFVLYTVKSSESLSEILQKFKMNQQEFEALNTDININNLSRGQQITVLAPPSRNYANPYLQKANLEDLGSVPASRYSDSEVGNTTTNGELYDPELLTAAHNSIALGSVIFIENSSNGRGVYVKINDRVTGNGIKLSKKAFNALQIENGADRTVTLYINN